MKTLTKIQYLKTLKNKVTPSFEFKPFSIKQLKVLSWWKDNSPVKDRDIIIADGSVRSGKTISMSLSFVLWASSKFNNKSFAICGKTIGSLRRNVIKPLKEMLEALEIPYQDHSSMNYLTIGGNDYYLFGGQNEASQDLIQGMTLAGVLFDEVALQVQSFVNQAMARCSIEDAKMWFNCNPAGPKHWFKLEFIDKIDDKNGLYLHFNMDDNLTLSNKKKSFYRSMYSGVFFKRYILGLWVNSDGAIYDMFNEDIHVVSTVPDRFDYYLVGIDFGMQNPTAYTLCGVKTKYVGNEAITEKYIIKEYYYNGRESNRQKTVSLLADEFIDFIGDYADKIKLIYLDPSAIALKNEIIKVARQKDIGVRFGKTNNSVLDGIITVSNELQNNTLYILNKCKNTINEFYAYIWDNKAADRGEDKPVKTDDHAMDSIRYIIHSHFAATKRLQSKDRRLYGI